jgi:isoquinoline 1-oxidoreductase beta subunit
MTGGSTSTRATGQFGMRVAGAAAKAMLLEAAARRFQVPVIELSVSDSRITHPGSGQAATFGELAADAATLPVPNDPPLKAREDYRLVGTPQPRHDIPGKVKGEARYGIDVVVEDMLYAAIAAAPIPGGELRSVDPAPALAVPGVREVVSLPNAVAVLADGYWQATQGLRALAPDFSDAGVGAVDSERIYADHAAAVGSDDDVASLSSAQSVSAEYRVPYLAHATMEPMCATARFAEGRLEVWAGTQDPLNARRVAAAAADLDASNVVMHNLQLGGGFGRRLPGNFDYVEQAVRVAMAISPRAVKLIWSREEVMQHDYYRPVVFARMRGELNADGHLLLWKSRFTGSRFMDVPAATPP